MKKQLITTLLIAAIAMSAVGCGKEAKKEEKTDIMAEGDHDGKEKENTVQDDLDSAEDMEEGSTETLQGTYKLEGSDSITYTFDEKKMSLIETGSYNMSDGKITLKYGNNKETEYEIKETEAGFNLIHKSNLLPLVYMEGTDGLTGDTEFDGIYSMSDVGFVFIKDGSLKVVTTHDDLEVKKDTVTFAGQKYDWEAKDGKIVLSSNGTKVMTLIP